MLLTDIIGHARAIASLTHAHHNATSHHAYLFEGPPGVGKRRVAVGFAALGACDAVQAGARDACGVCRHCRRILASVPGEEGAVEHPDVLWLVPDSARATPVITIAQVREVLRIVPFPPLESPYRTVIVEPADALGEEAANALLKTLEEPPSRTRFVLVTGRSAGLLTTILSRCQRVRFGRLTDVEVSDLLVSRRGWDPERAARLVPMADGSVGAALALEEDPVMGARDELVQAFLAIPPGDAAAAMAFAERLGELGPARSTALDLLQRALRDALLVRIGVGRRLFLEDLRAPLTAWAGRYGTSAILARIELVEETRLALRTFHTQSKLTLERLALALSAPPGAEGVRPLLPHLAIL